MVVQGRLGVWRFDVVLNSYHPEASIAELAVLEDPNDFNGRGDVMQRRPVEPDEPTLARISTIPSLSHEL